MMTIFDDEDYDEEFDYDHEFDGDAGDEEGRLIEWMLREQGLR